VADLNSHFHFHSHSTYFTDLSNIMRPESLAIATAASLAALSLVQSTSAASGNGTAPQLSASKHPESKQLLVFERAGGRSGNKPKSTAPSGAATAFSTSTIPTASTKTRTKTTTQTSEATQSPDPDKAAAKTFFDLTNDQRVTDCVEEARLREDGYKLISEADSADDPYWAQKVGTSMAQWTNVTACPQGFWDGNNPEITSLNATAGRLVAGNQTTAA
jgi:hypothetical protein